MSDPLAGGASPGDPAPGGEKLPEPSFDVLVALLAGPCFIHLGLVENPSTGKTQRDLPQAKWAIDCLHVLEEKTRGNLSDAERARLSQILHHVRTAYADASK